MLGSLTPTTRLQGRAEETGGEAMGLLPEGGLRATASVGAVSPTFLSQGSRSPASRVQAWHASPEGEGQVAVSWSLE